jgi:hypothetical protein
MGDVPDEAALGIEGRDAETRREITQTQARDGVPSSLRDLPLLSLRLCVQSEFTLAYNRGRKISIGHWSGIAFIIHKTY